MPKRVYDHKREDLPPAPGREVFAGILFDFFDRTGWWRERQFPWKRLSLMVTNSPQNVERWVREGVMPSWEHLEELERLVGVPAQVLHYTLKYNRLPEAAPTLSQDKAILHAAVESFSAEEAAEWVPIFRRRLAEKQAGRRQKRSPTS